jgi:DNA-binding beta-propeller fold protein YncE
MRVMRYTPLLLGLLLTACASPRQVSEDDGFHPSWPGEGEPRIVHVRNLAAPRDVGRPTLLGSLGRALTGAPPQRLVRPSSVAVDGERLLVSDQELQGVHMINLQTGKGRFFAKGDDRYFVSPVGVAIIGDRFAVADGSLAAVFLLDNRGRLVRRIEPADGFKRPTGLAYDPQHDELYVVDTVANNVIVFDIEGNELRRFGDAGSDVEQFNFPTHVFVDQRGRVLVTDSLNFRVQVFSREGQYQFDIGRHGDATGHLGVPKGVAVDSDGYIYIIDSYFSTVQIFDDQGQFLLNFGDVGDRSGQFQVPTGITITPDDHVYVCDSYNSRIQVFQYLQGASDETPQPNNP